MLSKFAIKFILLYKKNISPLMYPRCRFIPTCSEYGIESIKKYGFLKGSYKLILRILRCNPFGPSGYDPVD